MTPCVAVLLLAALAEARDFKAGAARVDITPAESIWLSGYAARTKPSEGVAGKLWAKALAIQDGSAKAVIVTTDLIGLPRNVSDIVAARALKEYGIDRAFLLMNSSHTHAGPVVRPNLMTMYFLTGDQHRAADAYAEKLTEDLFTVIGAALGKTVPAKLSVGHGQVGFAINRRAQLKNGPTDHDVPVLAVHDTKGKLIATLFGYACHNTTLGGDFYQVSGDYAGAAQREFEAMQPDSTAMFMILTAADQNPSPRGTMAHVNQHGKALATEVNRVVTGKMKPIQPGLRAAQTVVDLQFKPHSREQFEKELAEGNRFQKSRAQAMLKLYDQRAPIARMPYPVQAIRLGNDFTIAGMGGEVVVDYGLQTKREFAGHDVMVAGYTHDVMSYIPNVRILREGGYEANDSMIYYGLPGPYSESVEEIVTGAIRGVLTRVGLKPARHPSSH